MTAEETQRDGAGGGDAGQPNISACEIVFSGTMRGSVFVGDQLPYEAHPWYRKTPFAVALIVVGGFAFAAFVALVVARGAVELLARSHAPLPGMRAMALASVLIWGACMVLNVARVLKNKAIGMSAFDLATAAASPALVAGGFLSAFLYAWASLVSVALIGAAVVACAVSIFKDPAETPLETRGARAVEAAAVVGAFFLVVFALYTL